VIVASIYNYHNFRNNILSKMMSFHFESNEKARLAAGLQLGGHIASSERRGFLAKGWLGKEHRERRGGREGWYGEIPCTCHLENIYSRYRERTINKR